MCSLVMSLAHMIHSMEVNFWMVEHQLVHTVHNWVNVICTY